MRKMSPAEIEFKWVIRDLIRSGVHPTMTPINQALGRIRHKMNTLNGRECRWLRVDMQVPAIKVEYPICSWHCCNDNGRLPTVRGPA